MSIFSFLFGKRDRAPSIVEPKPEATSAITADTWQPPAATQRGARVQWRDGSFPMQAVGESHYQEALIAICGKHTRYGHDGEYPATITLEPSNPYDSGAVVVQIQGRRVGYLPRDQAARVGGQMRAEGLNSAACRARVRGGWRTNQHDEGHYGVWLAIPNMGWIDFGTGAERPSPPPRPRPERAIDGPLSSVSVAVLGGTTPERERVKALLAAAGARTPQRLGKTTTVLLILEDRPFPEDMARSTSYQAAEAMIAEGRPLRILSASEARAEFGLEGL